MKKILGAIALLLLSSLALAQPTYHFKACDGTYPALATPVVGCTPGNNANDGLTESTPKLNAAGLSPTNLPAGTRFKFYRGGVWGNSWPRLVVKNNNSTVANPFIIEDYGPAENAPPTIISDGSQPYANCTALCKIPFEFQTTSSRWDLEGYIVRNIRFRGLRDAYSTPPVLGSNSKVSGVWAIYFNPAGATNVILDNLDIEGFSLGVESGGDATISPVRNITIRNSSIRNNSQGIHGVYNKSLIENNLFDRNGHGDLSQAAFIHNVYFSGFIRSIFRNNTLRANAYDTATGLCQSVSLIIHGSAIGSIFENNLWDEPSPGSNCFAFSVDPGYGTSAPPEEFRDLVIRGNTIIGWGNYGIGMSSCIGCVVENNRMLKIGSSTGGCAICVPGSNASNGGIHGGQDVTGSLIHVRNNTIIQEGHTTGYPSTCIRVLADATSGGGTGHTITNNMCVFKGATVGTQYCFNVGVPAPGVFASINNNLCHAHAAVTNLRWSQQYTLGEAQGLGFSTTHISTDPLFVVSPSSANGVDTRIQTSSPAKNAGHTTYKSRLGFDALVPTDARDIGADEFGATSVAPASPSGLRLQ
jgi:hypothetical protein